MSVLGTHLYQCTNQLVLLWEAAFGLSEFFLKTLQCVCPFHDVWFRSTPSHTVVSVQQFLTKNNMTPVRHPPYSPDLAPSNYFHFLRWKKFSKGKFLLMRKRWHSKWQKHLKGIKIDKLKNCFKQWKESHHRCIASNGEYFEGDWRLNM